MVLSFIVKKKKENKITYDREQLLLESKRRAVFSFGSGKYF
jgi:hypothetical protein